MNPNPALVLVIFISIASACNCNASFFHFPRKLAAQTPNQKAPAEVSPSPAPATSSHGEAIVTDERCLDSVIRRCHDDINHMIACVINSDASKGLFLLVQNDGEGPLQVTVRIIDVEVALPVMQIREHQAQKINISGIVEGSPSIILNTGKENCTIPMESQGPGEKIHRQFLAYGVTHITPVYGAYMFFLTALIVGGAWACCKLAKSERHLNGVPYQELEMEQPQSRSVSKVETDEGWDEGWNDEWGEIKEVKTPNGSKTADVSANGHIPRTSDKDGWGNDWED